MSGVGETAAILQLVGNALLTAHTVSKACQSLYAASDEVRGLKGEVDAIRDRLESCRDAVNDAIPSNLRTSVQNNVKRALKDLDEIFSELNSLCNKVQKLETLQQRLSWICRHKKQADALQAKLRRAEESLSLAILPALMCSNSRIISYSEEIKHAVVDLRSRSDRSDENFAVVIQQNRALMSSLEQLSLSPSATTIDDFEPRSVVVERGADERWAARRRRQRRLSSSSWRLDPAWAYLGVTGKGVSTQQVHKWEHYRLLKVVPPFLGLEFSLSWLAKTIHAQPMSFEFLRGLSLDVSRVVPTGHPFMEACTSGDLEDVRAYLESGAGRVSDRDGRNWTPLACAIRSKNRVVVEELLNRGADKNGKIGDFETTPLEWAIWHKNIDITRLLLDAEATQDHVNMRGWNTPFFCWARLRSGGECMLGLLNLLDEYDVLDLEVADDQDWTVLDRVAAVGTAREVRRLIELGAKPEKVAMPLRWMAIHQAVFYGNIETFEELRRHYEKVECLVDERGWTLLHIAASAGHEKVVERLLELGADPGARSYVMDKQELLDRMPQILHGRACNPQEVAAAQSPEREASFLKALEAHQSAATLHAVDFLQAQGQLEAGSENG